MKKTLKPECGATTARAEWRDRYGVADLTADRAVEEALTSALDSFMGEKEAA